VRLLGRRVPLRRSLEPPGNTVVPSRWQATTAEAIVHEGIATAEEVEVALASLADFAEDPASLCGSPRVFQAWSRRTRD
jgi:hypothetical protein